MTSRSTPTQRIVPNDHDPADASRLMITLARLSRSAYHEPSAQTPAAASSRSSTSTSGTDRNQRTAAATSRGAFMSDD